MDDSITTSVNGGVPQSPSSDDRLSEATVGSPEHLHAVFEHAVAVADRAVGLWLASRSSGCCDDYGRSSPDASHAEIRALRTLVRASARAYARRLRDSGMSPERMVVLVKQAAHHPGAKGFAVRELTSDIVLWSIEAYFDD